MGRGREGRKYPLDCSWSMSASQKYCSFLCSLSPCHVAVDSFYITDNMRTDWSTSLPCGMIGVILLTSSVCERDLIGQINDDCSLVPPFESHGSQAFRNFAYKLALILRFLERERKKKV